MSTDQTSSTTTSSTGGYELLVLPKQNVRRTRQRQGARSECAWS